MAQKLLSDANFRAKVGNKDQSLVVAGKGEATQGGFMRDQADPMVDWLLANPGVYNNLVMGVRATTPNKNFHVSRDAVVVLSRVDPQTGRREFKAGLWLDFADPFANNSPFTDIKTDKHGNKKTHLNYGDGLANTGWWKGFVDAGNRLESQWKGGAKSAVVGGTSYKVNVVGYQNFASPVLVDLSRDGVPDLLAGGQAWKKGRSLKVREESVRKVDLDMGGARQWEWIGAGDGLLVWGDSLETPTATRLFGTCTWGKEWRDGYEPLGSLDADKDGSLKGKELGGIFVWVDSNTDAVLQFGELRTLGDLGIVSLGVTPVRDSLGNAAMERGVGWKDGTFGRTWDWWSQEFFGGELTSEVQAYDWFPLEEGSKVPGGYFVFTRYSNGRNFLLSFVGVKELTGGEGALIGFPFEVTQGGPRLFWQTGEPGEEMKTEALFQGKDLVGVTTVFSGGKQVLRYPWVAVPRGVPKK